MKITPLKCPSCGGPIELDEKDENIGYCQFCHTKYYLESEQPQVYVEYRKEQPKPAPKPHKNVMENQAVALLTATVSVIVVLAVIIVPLRNNAKDSMNYKVYTPTAVTITEAYEKEEKTRNIENSEVFYQFVEDVFGIGISSVTEEELGRLQYLSMKKSSESWVISYSFDNPLESAVLEREFSSVQFTDPLSAKDLSAFKGLKHLDIGRIDLEEGSLSGLTALKEITCDYISPGELHQALGEVSQGIERLELSHAKSLEELADFPMLKNLVLKECFNITDLSALAQLKMLVGLEIGDADEVTDFSVLNVMKNLETLSIDAEGLRDISFINHMENLTSLGVKGSQILLLEPLIGKDSLKELWLEDNGEVRDYSPIGTLTGLESLVLNKYTSQEDPDLTALTSLKKGEFHGMMGIGFLGSLTGLEELKIQGCNVDQPSVIASLPNLKKLIYRKVWGNSDDLSFLSGCKGLTYLDMNHSEFYGDLTPAFNLPALETLILDNSSFELNFDKLSDNPALKVLSLKKIKLYTNIEIWSEGIMRSIDYDNVLFDDHTAFLKHYPSLEYLNLRDNQLTDIQFVEGLKNLRELDLTDNYVTDLRALDQLEYYGQEGTVSRSYPDLDWADTVSESY